MHLKKPAIWYALASVIILSDQATKKILAMTLTHEQFIPLLPFFNLTLIHNNGAAFGFLSRRPELALWLFTGVALLMSVVLSIYLYRLSNQHWKACAFALILGGAIGNMIDRLMHGYVIDFLDVYYQNWHFPVFNLADCAISIGAIMLFLEIFFKKSSAHNYSN